MTLLHPSQQTRHLTSHKNRLAHRMLYVWSSQNKPIKREQSSRIWWAKRWNNWVTMDTSGHLSHFIKQRVLQRIGEPEHTICSIFHLIKVENMIIVLTSSVKATLISSLRAAFACRGKELYFLNIWGNKQTRKKLHNLLVYQTVLQVILCFAFLCHLL